MFEFAMSVEDLVYSASGTNGYCAFLKYDHVSLCIFGYRLYAVINVTEVEAAVSFGGCTDTDDSDGGIRDSFFVRKGGEQIAGFDSFRDEAVQSQLVEMSLARFDDLDFLRVHVEAVDFVTGSGKYGSGGKTNISCTDDSNVHVLLDYVRCCC